VFFILHVRRSQLQWSGPHMSKQSGWGTQ
jgi:hypothetical protein